MIQEREILTRLDLIKRWRDAAVAASLTSTSHGTMSPTLATEVDAAVVQAAGLEYAARWKAGRVED